MRGSKVQGRFKIDYETLSMDEGITDELRDPVGTTVDWWLWDYEFFVDHPTEVVDDIYDVSSSTEGEGRLWIPSFTLPVVMAQQIRGVNVMNERGFYVVDTLRVTISVADALKYIPQMINNPSFHIRDRVVFQNEVFTPTRVLPKGRYAERYSVITVECTMVSTEEMVNDPQFQQYTVNASDIETPVALPQPLRIYDGGNPFSTFDRDIDGQH